MISNDTTLYVVDSKGWFYALNKNENNLKKSDIRRKNISKLFMFDNLIYCHGWYELHILNRELKQLQKIDFAYDYAYCIGQYNRQFWMSNSIGEINIFGEYYQHQYQTLPLHQKQKLKNYNKIYKQARIHKDLALVFQRGLLNLQR